MGWLNTIFHKPTLEQKFFKACENGDLVTVRQCVKKGVNLNYRHQEAKRATGLYASIAHNHQKVSDYLLSLDEIDVNIPMTNGMTCLMASVQLNQLNTFYKLMSSPQIELDAQTHGSRASALHFACHGSNGVTYEEMAMTLINQGANVNLIRGGNTTALILVAENGNARVAKALLDHGADTEVREDMWNRTAAEVAVRNHHSEIAQLIGDCKRERQTLGAQQPTFQAPGVCVAHNKPAALIPTQGNQITRA